MLTNHRSWLQNGSHPLRIIKIIAKIANPDPNLDNRHPKRRNLKHQRKLKSKQKTLINKLNLKKK